MRIWMDPTKLAAHGLTPLDVADALNRENVELPAGKIVGTSTELTVKTTGRLYTAEEFNNLIIKADSNNTVKLQDIGFANLGPEQAGRGHGTDFRAQNLSKAHERRYRNVSRDSGCLP